MRNADRCSDITLPPRVLSETCVSKPAVAEDRREAGEDSRSAFDVSGDSRLRGRVKDSEGFRYTVLHLIIESPSYNTTVVDLRGLGTSAPVISVSRPGVIGWGGTSLFGLQPEATNEP